MASSSFSSWTDAKPDPLLPTTRDLDVEEAEGAVFRQIEGRPKFNLRNLQTPKNDKDDDDEDMLLRYHAMHEEKSHRPSLKQVANRVKRMNRVAQALLEQRKNEKDGLWLSADRLDHHALREDYVSYPRTANDDEPVPFSPTADGSDRKRRGTCCSRFLAFLHPMHLLPTLYSGLSKSTCLWVGLPLSVLAAVLYYIWDDPELDFLPADATLSWWMNFGARLCVTLDLARVAQWVFVDGLLLATGVATPLVTLAFLQAKGWPFILTVWCLLNLTWLQGDNQFQRHWLFWTGWGLYTESSGDEVLNSETYLRILVSGVVAGTLTCVKRTFVAMQFGVRQLMDFQPRLEKILADVVIMDEVATLAAQAEQLDDSRAQVTLSQPRSSHGRYPSVDFRATEVSSEDDEGSIEMEPPSTSRPHLYTTDSSVFQIKEMLDRWQEPTNKRVTTTNVAIGDILRFRRALSYLNDTFPFGNAFGRATNRDQGIACAQSVFRKLMKLTSQENSLSFDVLQLLATEEDGTEDRVKNRAIRRLFRPDKDNKLSLLAFVQSCDNVYKKFRYFRASVANANVINDVLEGLLNTAFFFLLGLLLLSVLKINPWTLLLSLTSVLVSVSFALGSSVSKYVEGINLIAVRHPYDLGDRIFFCDATGSQPDPNVSSKSWFVEDITLTTTTLRYARTNEVSTVNNWSIADTRIVNLNYSLLATVFLEMRMHLSIFDNDNLQKFRSALDKYVADRPRMWDSVSFCRHEEFNADDEFARFAIAVRHCSSWQDASRIKIHRADLVKFLFETSKALSVHYEAPPPQQVMYYGGVLKEGEIEKGYKRELLSASNILSQRLEDGSQHPLDAVYPERRDARRAPEQQSATS